jgi:hypothetical protein
MRGRAGDHPIHRLLLESSPRRLMASAGVLMVAGGGLVGSGANFNATTTNTGSVVTAGILRESNSAKDSAILTAANLAPGGSATGTLDIANTGDLPFTESEVTDGLVDTPASAAFSAYLQLKVSDLGSPSCSTGCPAPVTLYDGSLRGAVGTADLGTLAPGDTHRYRFTVTYPDGGAGAENPYAGAKAAVDVTWKARQ